MKKLKKAFTIVELVIVIAVIAILAAVLIPTFVNVAKKAKLSNDQAQVRQMNLVAAMDQATDPYAYAGDAVNSLYNNGWNTAKLSSYSSGYHYAYDLEGYSWYLLDEKGDIVFPESSSVSKDKLWALYQNQSADVVEGITHYIAVDNVTVDSHYQAGFGSSSDTDYVIDLNGGYIGTTIELTNVTVVNGILVTGAQGGEGINTGYTVLTEWSTDNATTMENGVICFEKTIFNEVEFSQQSASYQFTDCVFFNTNFGSSVDNGDRAFYNCKFTFTTVGKYVIYAAKNLTVENCVFTNCSRGINLINTTCTSRPANRQIKIINNVFNGITEEKAIIQLAYGYCSSTHSQHNEYGETVQTDTVVEISGNTFNSLGAAVGIIRVHEGLGTKVTEFDVEALVNNVTFANNKVNDSIEKSKYVIDDDIAFNEAGISLVAQLLAKFH